MPHARRRAGLLLVAFVVAGCAGGAPNASTTNTDADVKAVEAAQDRELQLLTASLDSIGAVYTDDVDFMPPGEPAIQGIDAAKKWAQAMLAQVNMSGKYTSSRVTVSGDVAVSRYTATLSTTPKSGGAASEETVKGIHVLKRQPGGAWKIAIDTWNTDKAESPPPAPAPAAKKK